MTWTYYREGHPNGDWTLFRSMPGRFDEIYRYYDGWHPTETLFDSQHNGDITESDIISEAEAEAIIASLPPGNGPLGKASSE